ncbi:MAG TPA: zinc-ribbon domain-containing protein [Blastocatellia bacterium]|nr:zinc-ribbon domain-containing protein [Blastocatellia bacterium]
MFCPQCGSTQSDDIKFCKSCGANLFAVRQVVATRETGGKFDWSKTWVAEMMLSGEERERRSKELERQRGMAPGSTQSQKEIKAGVITTSVGIGLAIFLFIFMQGIIAGGNIDREATAILSRLWILGVIPFFVGLGLLINGLFVKGSAQALLKPKAFEKDAQPLALSPGDNSEFTPSSSSVTEHTTRQLRDSDTGRP